MNALAAYGLLAHSIVFAALFALIPFGEFRTRAVLTASITALLAGIAPLLHGVFGAPSLTLLQLAILQIAGRTPAPLSHRAALGLLIFALGFYPLALGWGPFDPYALGYQPLALLAALLPLGGLLFWRRQSLWLLILAVDLAGYAGGLFANLWDALLDPLLFLLALAVVVRRWRTSGSATR
jgi:hypothetical protein